MSDTLAQRRALLTAALGFLQVRWGPAPPPPVAALERSLNSWAGVGAVIVGMRRLGYDVALLSVGPERWEASFLEANPVGGAPLTAGYAEERTLRRAVQQAAWEALRSPRLSG